MKWDEAQLASIPDPTREAVGLPLGKEGAFFTALEADENLRDTALIDLNRPSRLIPDLWCEWKPNDEGTAIQWSEGECFYNYVEWLDFLLEHFLKPWGYKLNGVVFFQGDHPADKGAITVLDNVIRVVAAEDVKVTERTVEGKLVHLSELDSEE